MEFLGKSKLVKIMSGIWKVGWNSWWMFFELSTSVWNQVFFGACGDVVVCRPDGVWLPVGDHVFGGPMPILVPPFQPLRHVFRVTYIPRLSIRVHGYTLYGRSAST